MAVRQDTIWERFLAPIARLFIDEEELRQYAKSVDWERESQRFARGDVITPEYYSSQNFHGIEGGYLNSGAAVSYDAITQYVTPPNENWVRQAVIDAVQVIQPRRIIDLGCGTGSTTLILKEAFPEAEVVGLDLSPYMLVRASHKAENTGLDISWRHGNAEQTGFPENSFDLVTATLLFHETPPAISQIILHESFRLLVPGGQALILDGNQKNLRNLEWLNDLFEEPYIRDYGGGSVDAWMGAAKFGAVHTEDVWWVHQLTSGIKPISNEDGTIQTQVLNNSPIPRGDAVDDNGSDGVTFPSPAYTQA